MVKKCALLIFVLVSCHINGAEQQLRLLQAFAKKDFAAAHSLLEKEVSPDYRTDDGASPLHEALVQGYSANLYEKMLEKVQNKAALNKKYGNPESFLIMSAAKLKKPCFIAMLIKAGASCNVQDDQGNTILYALRDYDEQELSDEALSFFEQKGCDCNIKNSAGQTVFSATLTDIPSIETNNRFIFLKRLVNYFKTKLSHATVSQTQSVLGTLFRDRPSLKHNKRIIELQNLLHALDKKYSSMTIKLSPVEKTALSTLSPRFSHDSSSGHTRRSSIEVMMPELPLQKNSAHQNTALPIQTLLMEAVIKKDSNLIQARLARGDNPLELHLFNNTPLFVAFRVVRNFLNHGDRPGEQHPFKNSPPFIGLEELLKTVSKNGKNDSSRKLSSFSITPPLDTTPACVAFRTLQSCLKHSHKYLTVPDALTAIHHFLNVKDDTQKGKAILTSFHSESCVNFLKPLLAHVTDRSALNLTFGPDNKLLYSFVLSCHEPYARQALLKLLIEQKADVNARDKDNNSILHNTCYPSASDIEFLLGHGFDPNVPNRAGETPVDHAVKKRWFEIISKFVSPDNKIPLLKDTAENALKKADTLQDNDGSVTARGETIIALLKKYLATP